MMNHPEPLEDLRKLLSMMEEDSVDYTTRVIALEKYAKETEMCCEIAYDHLKAWRKLRDLEDTVASVNKEQ